MHAIKLKSIKGSLKDPQLGIKGMKNSFAELEVDGD
jgi:hypothetical protein